MKRRQNPYKQDLTTFSYYRRTGKRIVGLVPRKSRYRWLREHMIANGRHSRPVGDLDWYFKYQNWYKNKKEQPTTPINQGFPPTKTETEVNPKKKYGKKYIKDRTYKRMKRIEDYNE